jgi:hypothetical protein
MKISEIEVGFKFEHGTKGECVIILRTPRTITIKHRLGTTKTTFKYKDDYFSPSDF